MPRNMSFMFTKKQVREKTKTVTRRIGWLHLRAGDSLWAVEQAQGLGKGGKIKRMCQIEVVDVRQERLIAICENLAYGRRECIAEGFPEMTPPEFLEFFMASHRGCQPHTQVTRIEFRYL